MVAKLAIWSAALMPSTATLVEEPAIGFVLASEAKPLLAIGERRVIISPPIDSISKIVIPVSRLNARIDFAFGAVPYVEAQNSPSPSV